MAHKQIPALKGQLAQVTRWLTTLDTLAAGAMTSKPGDVFPVRMRATSTADCIGYARLLLEGARNHLQAGIDYFENFDKQQAELKAKGEEAQAELAKLEADAAEEEKLVAGHAVAAVSALTAATTFFPKIEEGVPSYRG